MDKPIVLKKAKSPRYDGLTGMVRLTPEAEMALRRISGAAGLPMRAVASEILIQAESLIQFAEED